jgi:uncharacterized repeat protein (TIGR02543 family)
MIKRLFKQTVLAAVAICMLMTGAFLVAPSFGAEEKTVQANIITGGLNNGTAENPFLIGNAATMQSLFQTHLSTLRAPNTNLNTNPPRHFVLTSDIDMPASWTPRFLSQGDVFDGQGFTLRNFRCNTVTDNSIGLFASMRGTVRNLNFEGVAIAQTTQARYVGVLAGRVVGGTNATAGNANSIVFTSNIENVRVNGGVIGVATSVTGTTNWHTGGLIGSIDGQGINNNRFNVNIRNSYVELTSINGRGGVGGIVGNIGTATSATAGSAVVMNFNTSIDNCYFVGNINANHFAGGIVGRATYISQNSVSVSINSCFARGRFHTADRTGSNTATDADTHSAAGGIVGRARPSSTADRALFIRDSFAIADLQNAVRRGGILGAYSNNTISTSVAEIVNSHYSTDAFGITGHAHVGTAYTGAAAIGITQSASHTTSHMNSQSFADFLNTRGGTISNTNTFRIRGGVMTLTIFDNVVFLTFDPNGGRFAEGNTEVVQVIVETTDSGAVRASKISDAKVTQPVRDGYTFNGWNGNLQHSFFNNYTENIDIRAIASWTAIDYTIEFDSPVPVHYYTWRDNLESYAFVPEPITLNIFERGYFSTVPADGYKFLNWQVRDYRITNPDASNAWVNLGSGQLQPGAISEQRLHTYDLDNSIYLIDADFIKYANGNKFTIKPTFFPADDAITLSITSQTSLLGRIAVDGAPQQFGSEMNFEDAPTININVEVIPNRHRKIASVTFVGQSDGTLFPQAITAEDGEPQTFLVNAKLYREVRVAFVNREYDIRVVARVFDEEYPYTTMAGLTDAIGNTATGKVQIGGNYSNTIQSIDGFQLISPSMSNIRILNHRLSSDGTNVYDSFSAVNGRISFTASMFTANFFDNYLDEDGMITVIAVYVRQYSVQLQMDTSNAPGTVVLTVEENGVTNTIRLTETASLADGVFVQSFASDATVTIDIIQTSGILFNELPIQFQSFRLSENTIVPTITFTRQQYTIRILAETTEATELTLDGTFVLNGGNLAVDTVRVLDINENNEILRPATDPDGYSFVGWFALVGSQLLPLEHEPATRNLTGGVLDLNDSFMSIHMEGNELTIVAVYAAIVALEVSVAGGAAGRGSFSIHTVDAEGNDLGLIINRDTEFESAVEADTFVKIYFHPNAHYELSADTIRFFDGNETFDGESVIMQVNQLNRILVTYVPTVYTVTLNSTNTGKGSISADIEMSIDRIFFITFTLGSGHRITGWSIAGVNPASSSVSNMAIYGNSVRIEITPELLATAQDGTIQLNITVKTRLHELITTSIIIASILLPVLVALFVWMMMMNNKKKAYHTKVMAQFAESNKRLGAVDKLKDILDLKNEAPKAAESDSQNPAGGEK